MDLDLKFTRCCAKNLSYFLTLFFVFILASALLNSFFIPPLKTVNSWQLPKTFPLLTVWNNETGTKGCRIISYEQLEELKQKVGKVTFIPKNDSEHQACEYALDYFDLKHKWPTPLTSDTPSQHSQVFYKVNDNKIQITCNLSETESRKSRYSVSQSELQDTFFLHQKKQGFNYKSLPYAFLFTILLWLFYKLYKHYQKL